MLKAILLTSQTSERGTLRHKKAPQDNLRRFLKMERAKRLELIRDILQPYLNSYTYDTVLPSNAAIDASQFKAAVSSDQLNAWTTELEEIVRAWPMLNPSVQGGLMAIIRSQATEQSQARVVSSH